MPIYATKCPECGFAGVIFRKVDERDTDLSEHCGGKVQRVISAPFLRPDITPYVSPNGNYMVHSRAEQTEDLKKSNAILWEPGLDEQIKQNRVSRQEEAFKPLAAAVDETVSQLVAAGKLET